MLNFVMLGVVMLSLAAFINAMLRVAILCLVDAEYGYVESCRCCYAERFICSASLYLV
jgi:hypothetical protein